MADSKVVFDIIARDKASSAFGSAGRGADTLGTKLGSMAKGAGAALGVAAGAAGIFAVKLGVDAVGAARESAKVTALTEQVIKSMGGAAGFTADQVADMSTRLSNATGVDDEVIQSGANLLLTFGNISKEGGVFDKTLALANDMSVALGQDMSSSSIMLGKALNDPIKGITALTRSGVSFTEQQKEQIKTLTASGDLLGAQGIILEEVGKQFGGAAEAAATPMDRLKVTLGNLQEEVGARLIPIVDQAAVFFANNLPAALDFAGEAFGRVVGAFNAVSDWWANNGPTIIAGVTAVRDSIVAWIAEVEPAIRSWVDNVLTSVSTWWTTNSATIIALATGMKDGIVTAFRAAQDAGNFLIENWDKVKYAVGVLAGLVVAAWTTQAAAATVSAAKQVASWIAVATGAQASAVGQSKSTAQIIAGWVLHAAQATLHAAKVAAAWLISMGPIAIVGAAVAGLVALFVIHFDTIRSTVSGAWEWVKSKTTEAWAAVKTAVSGGVTDVVSTISGIPGKITGAIGNMKTLLASAGRDVIDGFISGITGAFSRVRDKLSELTGLLPDWKGPAERDRRILRPSGQMVMAGFVDGLRDKESAVKGFLAGVTDRMSVPFRGDGLVSQVQGALGSGSWLGNFNSQMKNLVSVFESGEDVANGAAEVIDNMFGNTGKLIPAVMQSGEQIGNLWKVISGGTDVVNGMAEVLDNMFGNTGQLAAPLAGAIGAADLVGISAPAGPDMVEYDQRIAEQSRLLLVNSDFQRQRATLASGLSGQVLTEERMAEYERSLWALQQQSLPGADRTFPDPDAWGAAAARAYGRTLQQVGRSA